MESGLWTSEGFNRSATTANSGMLSPNEVFFRGRPPIPILPFCKPAYHRVPRQSKIDDQTRPCLFLNFGDNHGSDCFKIVDAETGRVVHSRDVTWHQPREPLFSPAPTVGSGVPQSSSGAEKRVHSVDTCSCYHACRCAGACISHRRTRAATKPPSINSRSRCSGTGARGGRAYAWPHARRNARDEGLSPQHGSDVPCRIGARIGHPRGVDEAFRKHELPQPEADLPTAPASDLPTPSTIAEAESSEHAEIWRGSRAREFSGLLQAHTFGPT